MGRRINCRLLHSLLEYAGVEGLKSAPDYRTESKCQQRRCHSWPSTPERLSSAPDSRPSTERLFHGVRIRSWGRWVSEIRIADSRDKILAPIPPPSRPLAPMTLPPSSSAALFLLISPTPLPSCIHNSKLLLQFPSCSCCRALKLKLIASPSSMRHQARHECSSLPLHQYWTLKIHYSLFQAPWARAGYHQLLASSS